MTWGLLTVSIRSGKLKIVIYDLFKGVFMKKLIFVILFISSIIASVLPISIKSEENQVSGFITEIINNTDKSVYFFVKTHDNICSYITTSISLKTQEEKRRLKGSRDGTTIAPRTRCLIANLKLPKVKANWSDQGSMREHSYHYMGMNFSEPYCDRDKRPMPFLGFRQRGNTLEVLEGRGLHSIHVNGQNFSPHHWFENIENNSTYTIEINQITRGIFHRKSLGSVEFLKR